MNALEPSVSIVIPTKNRHSLLEEALTSVKDQTYPHWEVIVVDDGSDPPIADKVGSRFGHDSRMRFFERSGQPSGAPRCRNIGLEKARGRYVIFLDSDDLIATDCLKHRVAVMEQNPGISFAVFACEAFHLVPGDWGILVNVPTDENDLDRFLKRDNPWQIHHPIWRRDVFKTLGGFDEALPSGQDWELHVRALTKGLPYLQIKRRDCYWRSSKDGRATICRDMYSPSHLPARDALLHTVHRRLQQHGKLTYDRRVLIAGLFYRLSVRSLNSPLGRDAAVAMLRRAWNTGCFPFRDYALAMFYVRSQGWRGVWRFRPHIQRYLAHRFDSSLAERNWCRHKVDQ